MLPFLTPWRLFPSDGSELSDDFISNFLIRDHSGVEGLQSTLRRHTREYPAVRPRSIVSRESQAILALLEIADRSPPNTGQGEVLVRPATAFDSLHHPVAVRVIVVAETSLGQAHPLPGRGI